jgi:Tfp pilus assembly protein PilP
MDLNNLNKKDKIIVIVGFLVAMQFAILYYFNNKSIPNAPTEAGHEEIFRISKQKRDSIANKNKQATEQEKFLQEFEENMKEPEFTYDAKNKKDPFRSFDFAPRKIAPSGNTEVEKYSYAELKLTAIVQGFDQPKAILEDPTGKGHTIGIGSKVGNLGGEVIAVDKNKISILETSIDFQGKQNTRTVEIFLR